MQQYHLPDKDKTASPFFRFPASAFFAGIAVCLATSSLSPALAQQYNAGTGVNLTIPPGGTASVATGSAIIATGGGTVTGTGVAASSSDTGNVPVVSSTGTLSLVTLSGNTTITGNGTGVRMDNGGLVSLPGTPSITINGSNSGSAGILINNTAAGAMAPGIGINFTTTNAHTGTNAWIGVSLTGASSASFDGLNVTSNSTALGLVAADTSTLTLTNSTFTFDETVSGGAYESVWTVPVNLPGFTGGGAYIKDSGATINATDTTFDLTSLGGLRWGIWADTGTFNGTRVSLTLPGRGVDVSFAGHVDLNDSTITITNGGIGALVGLGDSVFTGSGVTITTVGATGTGVQAQGGGDITLTDSVIDAQGANSVAIRAGNTTGVVTGLAKITLLGGTATSAGTAIQVTSNLAQVTLNDGVEVTGNNGILMNVTSTGNVTLTADNGSLLSGDMQAAVANTSTVMLSNSIAWTGVAHLIGPTSISGDSTWTMTGNSDVASLALDGSTIAFTAPVSNVFKTLTTVGGGYVGTNGTIRLNTALGADGSPSDLLIVSGGTATGTTTLNIANAGGAGALTTGDGILVVQATNSATTAGAFTLAGGSVRAGDYVYSLYHGDASGQGENWYLRSVNSPAPGSTPIPTLGSLALLLLAGTLGVIGLGVARRRA